MTLFLMATNSLQVQSLWVYGAHSPAQDGVCRVIVRRSSQCGLGSRVTLHPRAIGLNLMVPAFWAQTLGALIALA